MSVQVESPVASSVCPGDFVDVSSLNAKFGRGLHISEKNVVASLAGPIHHQSANAQYYWVENNEHVYHPRENDQVVGIIEERGGDFYRVNIFSGQLALLSRLAFEGATKRNRPELKRGDVIYTRVSACSKHCDTELSCISSSGSRKEWSSGETVS